MSRRWLLMLGSNLDSDARVHEAIAALAGLGPVRMLAPVRPIPSIGGDGRYHNALVELGCFPGAGPGSSNVLRQRIKAIETGLGRVRDDSGVVAIDIDLLACDDGAGWEADAHAVAKGEFARAPALQLLQEAGIALP